jgi:ABC-2 type transport system permease protein
MKNILRIAWRDFSAIATTKAFWIGMAMSPLIGFGFSMVARNIEKSQPTRAFVVIDRSGQYEEILQEAVDLQTLRALIPALRVRYSLYKDSSKRLPAISTEQLQGWLNNFRGAQQSEIAKEIAASGGIDKLKHNVEALLVDTAPAAQLPTARYRIVPPPPEINANANQSDLINALRPYLLGEQKIAAEGKNNSLYAAVIISAGSTGENPKLAYWSKNLSNNDVSNFIRNTVDRAVETERLIANGIEPEVLQTIQNNNLSIERFDITKATDAKESAVDKALRFVPIVFAGMLMLIVVINIGLLLQSIIEEKSNRLLEVLLSSVSPLQLMLGKLTGVAAITILTILSWLLIIASFIFFSVDTRDFGGDMAQAQAMAQAQMDVQIEAGGFDEDTIAAAIEVSVAVMKLLPVFIFYLVCGYLIYASLILALGSLCTSQQEANNLTTPIFLFLMTPMFIAPFIIRDPNGTLATVFTWIPFFTPTVILARFDSDLPLSDLLGSTALLLVTVVAALWISVKIFRFGALHAQQPPKFITLLRLVLQKDK